MSTGIDALSDKEKQTLRLLLAGYDAKSSARELGLSVHTINERLRDARRKLGVSSSREAARRLRAVEELPPQLLGDKPLGAAEPEQAAHHGPSDRGGATRGRLAWIIAGGAIMSLIFAIAALTMPIPFLSQAGSQAASEAASEAAAEQAARQWLAQVDAFDWAGSYAATSKSFQKVNTAKVWASVSQDVRVPLGAVRSRVLAGSDYVPAPPNGYRMIKFRTEFANKPATSETLTLVQEGGAWKISGYVIG